MAKDPDFEKYMEGDDFNLDDFDEKPKDRTIMDSAKSGVKNAIKNSYSLEKNIESAVQGLDEVFSESSIDREYGDIKDFISETMDNVSDNYESVKKEVGNLTRVVRDLTPNVFGLKDLIGKLVPDSDGEYRGESERARREREIKEGVTGALGTIEEFQAKIEESMKSASDQSSKSTNEILKEIAVGSHFNRVYQTEYTSKYYRKSLELQFRQTMLLKDILNINKAMAVDNKNFLGGILKNTSLPDILKQRTMEMLGNDVKVKLRSSFLDSFVFNKNVFRELGKNINNRIKEYGNSVKEYVSMGASMGGELLDLKNQMLEYGQDPIEMAIEGIGNSARTKVHKFFLTRLLNKVFSTNIGGNILSNVRRFYESPQHYFNSQYGKMLERESEGKDGLLTSLGKFLFGELAALSTTSNDTAKLKFNQEDLSATASFDFRTKKTINNVIPGLLGMLVVETKANRLGIRDEINLEKSMPVYDYIYDKFTTKNDITRLIRKQLRTIVKDKVDISGYQRVFEDDGFKVSMREEGLEMSARDQEIFAQAAVRASMESPYDGLELFKSHEFKKALPKELYDKYYTKFISAVEKEYKKGGLKDTAGEFVNLIRNATYSGRLSIPNMVKLLKERLDAGDTGSLLKLGILQRDEYDPTNSTIKVNRENIMKYMFKDFDINKEHVKLQASEERLKSPDIKALGDILIKAGEAGMDVIKKANSYLPERMQDHLSNIATAVSEDASKLSDTAEKKLFDGITKLDEYISSGEYKKLPEETKEKLLKAREVASDKLEEYYATGKGKLRDTFNKKNIKSKWRSFIGLFTKEKAKAALDISKDKIGDIRDKYKEYNEIFKKEGLKGLKDTVKSDASQQLSNLNEATLKKVYNKLPDNVRKELEAVSGNKKALLDKDYYVNVLSAAADSLPENYRNALFENTVSKGIKSTYTAIVNSETAKALGSATKDLKDYSISKAENTAIVKASKEAFEKMGISKDELKTKLELIEMINSAVDGRNPSLLDEVEELVKSYKFQDDKILMENIENGRNAIKNNIGLANRAVSYLAKITDPVEYSVAAGKVMGTLWNYVPGSTVLKLAGMGIGGYYKLLRKADKWVRDKIFMGGIKTLLKPFKLGYKTLETGLTGVGGAGLWGLGKLLGTGVLGQNAALSGNMMQALGKSGLSYAGNNIMGGVGMLGSLAKTGLGLGVGLPLNLTWKAIKGGTDLFGHITGLDHLNPFPWLGRKIYNGIWGKRNPNNTKIDSKMSYLYKLGKGKLTGLFSDSEDEETQAKIDDAKQELMDKYQDMLQSGEIDKKEYERLMQSLQDDSGGKDQAAAEVIETSNIASKKKASVLKKLFYLFGLRKSGGHKGIIGGIKAGMTAIKNFGSKMKSGLGKLKDKTLGAFKKVGDFFKGIFNRNKDPKIVEARKLIKALSEDGKKWLDRLMAGKNTSLNKEEFVAQYYDNIVMELSQNHQYIRKGAKVGNIRGVGEKKDGWLKSLLTKSVGFLGVLAIKGIGLFTSIGGTLKKMWDSFFSAKGFINKVSKLADVFMRKIYDPFSKFIRKSFSWLGEKVVNMISSFKGGGGGGSKGFFARTLDGIKKVGATVGDAVVKTGKYVVDGVKKVGGKVADIVRNAGMYIATIKGKIGSAWKSVCDFVVNIFKNPRQVLGSLLKGCKNAAGKTLSKRAAMKILGACCKHILKWLAGIALGAASTAYLGGAGGIAVAAWWLCSAGYGFIVAFIAGSTLLGCVIAAILGFDPLREFFNITSEEQKEYCETEEEEQAKKDTSVKPSSSDTSTTIVSRSKEGSAPPPPGGYTQTLYPNNNNTQTINNNYNMDTESLQKAMERQNIDYKAMNEEKLKVYNKTSEQQDRMISLLEQLVQQSNNRQDSGITTAPSMTLVGR